MHAEVGDRLVIKGGTVGQPDRDAEILETRGPDGTAPFVVRWDDTGHESLFFPGPDATVQHFEPGGPTQETVAVAIADVVRDEHRRMFAEADRLLHAADALDGAGDVLPDEVHEAFHYLETDVLPYAVAEGTELYPAIAELLGAPAATDPMTRQHVEIDRLATRLGRLRDVATTSGLDDATRRNLRQVLYGLHAILTLHLATEAELYLPLLDGRLTPKRSARLADALDQARSAARGTVTVP